MKKTLKYLAYFLLILVLIIFVLGQLNTSTIKKGNLKFSDKWQGKIINLQGEKVRVLQKGEGANVLLIHGTPGSIEDWNPIIADLSKDYKVTVFDRLASGFTTANNYNYTLTENVVFVQQLIKKLDLTNVVLVGHSYGGSIVTKMASENNDNIKSYISVAAPLYKLAISIDFKILSAPILGKGLTVFATKTFASKLIEDGLKATFGTNTNLLTPNFMNVRKQLWSQPKVLYATSKVRRNYNADLLESAKKYKNIKGKITFLVGENDGEFIVKDFSTIKKEVPNAEYIFLKNTAHFIQFEQTKKLLTVIKEHLKFKDD